MHALISRFVRRYPPARIYVVDWWLERDKFASSAVDGSGTVTSDCCRLAVTGPLPCKSHVCTATRSSIDQLAPE